MSLASLILWRKWTQIYNALKREAKQHGSSRDRAQLPLLTFSFSFIHENGQWWWSETLDFTYTSSALGLPACSELGVFSCVEGQWKAHEGRKKLSRSYWILEKHFTWPRPGPQRSGQCHSCSRICCQVQNSLAEVEQMMRWVLVGFLQQKHKEVSITRYFLAALSGTLERYVLVTAREKQLMRKRSFSTYW